MEIKKYLKISLKTVVIVVMILVGVILIENILIRTYVITKNQLSTNFNQEMQNKKIEKTDQPQNNEELSKSLPEVKSLNGVIKEVNIQSNYLLIQFKLEQESWASKVAVGENTFLADVNDDDQAKPNDLSLSDFKEGEKVIVSAKEIITKKETFQSQSIVKMK